MKELTKEELKLKVFKQERELSVLMELNQVLARIVTLLEMQNKELFRIVDLHEKKIKEYELIIKKRESGNRDAKRRAE